MKRIYRTILVMAASLPALCLLGRKKLELKVTARLDGQPAAQAKVTVDKEEQGLTGADGTFSKTIRKKPGADVEVVVVAKELPGFRIKPWKGTFLMKLPKSGSVDTYALGRRPRGNAVYHDQGNGKGSAGPGRGRQGRGHGSRQDRCAGPVRVRV